MRKPMLALAALWPRVGLGNTEGRPLTAPAIWARIDQKAQVWNATGRLSVFGQEFRDWASYCKSFARHQGIGIDP